MLKQTEEKNDYYGYFCAHAGLVYQKLGQFDLAEQQLKEAKTVRGNILGIRNQPKNYGRKNWVIRTSCMHSLVSLLQDCIKICTETRNRKIILTSLLSLK